MAVASFSPTFRCQYGDSTAKGYEYTLLPYFIKTESPLNHFLLYPFANFDAIYYLLIAATGYTVNAGFFPVFPLLVRTLAFPFGFENPFTIPQYTLATILVNGLTLASVSIFYKLVRIDYEEKISLYSVLGLLFFPTAFFSPRSTASHYSFFSR